MILLKLTRLWPFRRGRDFIFRNIPESMKVKMENQSSEISLKSETKIHIRKGDYLSRWYRLFGEYEKETMKLLQKYAKADEVFLDIGANLGVFSLEIAKTVGCDVIAFEPNPPTADCLVKSVRVNKLENRIKVFQTALSSERGLLNFIDSPINAGSSALETADTVSNNGDRYEVATEALDEFIDFKLYLSEVNKKVGLIKMDIEGAEVSALQGMHQLLDDHKPALIIELIDEQLRSFSSSKAELIKLLASRSFKLIHEFDGNGLFIHTSNLEGCN